MKTLKNLMEKGKNALVTAGLVGSLTLGGYQWALAGDKKPMSSELMILLGEAMTENPNSSKNERKIFGLLGKYGYLLYDKEIAREGSDKTNVNVYTGQQTSTQNYGLPENVIYSNGNFAPAPGYTWANTSNDKDLRVERIREASNDDKRAEKCEEGYFKKSWVFNKWEDIDKDNIFEPDQGECIGLKDVFVVGELIECFMHYKTCQDVFGKKVILRIFDESGNQVVYTDPTNNPYKQEYNARGYGLEGGLSKPGKYTIELYSEDNKLLNEHKIRIINK